MLRLGFGRLVRRNTAPAGEALTAEETAPKGSQQPRAYTSTESSL